MKRSEEKKYWKKPLLLASLVFAVSMVITQYISYQRSQIRQEAIRHDLEAEAGQRKVALKNVLQFGISSTSILSFLIQHEGIPQNFDSIAKELIGTSPIIDAIEIVEGGVISRVYPLKGNEVLLGYDLLNDSLRNREAFMAIQKKSLHYAGPFKLKQGGIGIVGRVPVFRENQFWGFVAVVIRLEALLKSAGLQQADNYIYLLGRINPNTGAEEFFPSNVQLNPEKETVRVELNDGRWTLYLQSTKNEKMGSLILSIMGFAFSLMAGILTWVISQEPERLRQKVAKQTLELSQIIQEKNAILENIGDAFFFIDKNFVITYWNHKAELLMGYDRKLVLGKGLIEMFGQFLDKDLFERHPPMGPGKSIHFEQEITRLGKTFDVRVNHMGHGFGIYFSDITSQKKHLEEIEQNNQRLREIAWIQSHHVRAPLARIMGISELLQNFGLSQEEREMLLKEIDKSAAELDEIIEEIVEKSRLAEAPSSKESEQE